MFWCHKVKLILDNQHNHLDRKSSASTDGEQRQQTRLLGFVRSVCYPCKHLLPLVGACSRRLNMLNWCLLGLGMSEK